MANLTGAVLPLSISTGGLFNSQLGADKTLLIGLSKWFGGRKIVTIKLGSDVVTIIMQAKDSVTGVIHTWPVSEPDFAGIYYPGPNTPIQISISEIKEES